MRDTLVSDSRWRNPGWSGFLACFTIALFLCGSVAALIARESAPPAAPITDPAPFAPSKQTNNVVSEELIVPAGKGWPAVKPSPSAKPAIPVASPTVPVPPPAAAATATPLEKFLAAAQRGDAAAQFKLGLMYYDGKHAEPDHAKAAQWIL